MDTLPKELHLLLFSFIPRIQDGCNFSSTCHYFRKLYRTVDPYLDEKKEIVRDNAKFDCVKYGNGKRLTCGNWGMHAAAKCGFAELVLFFVEKGAADWNWGMNAAAQGGFADLVMFFIEKGVTDWDLGMLGATKGGHAELVRFFVDKGATNWEYGMASAAKGGHAELVRFFVEKGATNWEDGMAPAPKDS